MKKYCETHFEFVNFIYKKLHFCIGYHFVKGLNIFFLMSNILFTFPLQIY